MKLNSPIDAWLAAGVVILVSSAVFLGIRPFACNMSRNNRSLIAFVIAGLLVAFGCLFSDSIELLRIMPLRNAIVYSNLMPLLAAILCAFFWSEQSIRAWKRIVGVGLLTAVSTWSLVSVFVANPPHALNKWEESTCLQTTESTCSAAAAATLLAHYGINASEDEMVRYCLTDSAGTRLHGLYRGLRMKTDDTQYRVVARRMKFDDLKQKQNLPVLLLVSLSGDVAKREPRYTKDWGWLVGVTHAVVLFNLTADGVADVADPAMGREHWDEQALKDLWHGVAIGLRTII